MARHLIPADTTIRNIKPKDKPYRLYDGDGLYLIIRPEGTSKGGWWWRLDYSIGGKRKTISLGTYPDTTLAQARKRADEARSLVQAGINPSEIRKTGKATQAKILEDERRIAEGLPPVDSFEAVAREWYVKQLHTWAPSHASDVLRRLESNIFPTLGHRPIVEIEAPELLQAVRKIEARGAHDLAHRVLQVCSQVFRYGVATGRCKGDPSPALRGALTPHKKKHQAAVKPEELPELWRAIEGYDKSGDLQTKLALQLLALTFVRTSELIGAPWEEFDLKAAIWVIPAERMKMKAEHLVPLSKQALAVLEKLKEISGGSRYVFPGRSRDKPISNNTLLFALYRLGYKGRMTGHGFRAVASTVLNEHGFRSDVIERQLAHSERNEIRGAYNRAEYLPERRVLMDYWSDHLENPIKTKENYQNSGNNKKLVKLKLLK